jgi:starch synthase
VFHHANYIALNSALRRALGLWYVYPDEFRKLIINGMRYDYSWNNPGHHYLNIYHHIRHK